MQSPSLKTLMWVLLIIILVLAAVIFYHSHALTFKVQEVFSQEFVLYRGGLPGDTNAAQQLDFPGVDLSRSMAILADPTVIQNGQTANQHVTHCLQQLVRFAHLAQKEDKFRAMQFGLNLGRAQELLGAPGGVDYWWRRFERVASAERWAELKTIAEGYLNAFGLEQPSEEFINRA